jgi:hypothetical protein
MYLSSSLIFPWFQILIKYNYNFNT